MRFIKGLVVSVLAMGTLRALGQAPADANTGRPMTEDDIAVLRQDVNTERTEIITRNMSFTEEQSKAFWPVYRDYAHDQQGIGDQRIALITDYAANHDRIDDAQAESYIERALKLEEDNLNLRRKYLPRFKTAIGARQTAKFYQVDNRLNLLTNVQLAALLPIIK
ncbi:MAG TPA: hypothetical protein VIX42_01945 [Edaphobacter sp.]